MGIGKLSPCLPSLVFPPGRRPQKRLPPRDSYAGGIGIMSTHYPTKPARAPKTWVPQQRYGRSVPQVVGVEEFTPVAGVVLPVEMCAESELSELSPGAKRRRTEEVTFRLSRISLMRGDRARWSNKSFVSRRWSRCSSINLSILPRWVAGFQAAEAMLVSRAARFGGGLWG